MRKVDIGGESGKRKRIRQAGAELGQAQLKLVLDFSFLFFRYDLSRFGRIGSMDYA